VKSQTMLDDFYAYCAANPEQRFWQALRNWAGVNAVIVTDGNEMLDTFYLKNNKGLRSED
jgi:ATP-dependent helicase YprA (DUF1998 family)